MGPIQPRRCRVTEPIISFAELVATPYFTRSEVILLKNFRAHSIFVSSILRNSMDEIDPFVWATKYHMLDLALLESDCPIRRVPAHRRGD